MKGDTDVLFSRKRTGAEDPTVNTSKAVLICNLFHFFFAASKACLLPFLTIFLRKLGMTATETGIIIAFKTITGFVWAPLWARCAITCNKRRFVLMFSVFMFAASYLSLAIVYQHTTNYNNCNHTLDSSNRLVLPSYLEPLFGSSSSTTQPPTSTHSATTTLPTVNLTSSVPFTTKPLPTTHVITSPSTTSISPSSTTTVIPKLTSTSQISEQLKKIAHDIIAELNLTQENIARLNATKDEFYDLIKATAPDLHLSKEESDQIWDVLMSESPTEPPVSHHQSKRSVKTSWDDIVQRSKNLWFDMDSTKIQLFLTVLLIIIVGELLSCSIEKVADDSWFDFLDRIDDLEKYGKQRLGGNFAFVFFPIGITILVNYTDCMLPLYVNHFLLHFYVFGAFLAVTFIVAFFYPVPPPQKQEFHSKVVKGLKIICCDCQGFLYFMTMLIMGMVYASYHNFLFWVIQDLGSTELNMGMCVSIGAFAEIPMLLISQKMVKKMGNAGVVSLALFFLSVRVLYYSFLPTPWAVMPAELLHAFTHTVMWFAVLSYDDFNVGAMIDRSIRSILSSVYFGVGFTMGCLLSGLFYDIFGYAILYQGASVLVGLWFIIFSIISKCIPKKERIRYVKLLQPGDTEESDSVEDDWLEMALKDN